VVGKDCAGIDFGRLTRGWLPAALSSERTIHGLRAGLRDHRAGERRRCSCPACTARARARAAPSVISPRLYVIDCGTLVYNRPEDYNLTREEVADTNMSVPCFLVIHAKGILLFDTGLSDRLVGRRSTRTWMAATGRSVQ